MVAIDYSSWDKENKVEYYKRQDDSTGTGDSQNTGNVDTQSTGNGNTQNTGSDNQSTNSGTTQNTGNDTTQSSTGTTAPQDNVGGNTAQTSTTNNNVSTDNQQTQTEPTDIKTIDQDKPKTSGFRVSDIDSKTDLYETKNPKDEKSGFTGKTYLYIGGGILGFIILFLIVIKIHRMCTKDDEGVNEETSKTKLTYVPTISVGNAVPTYPTANENGENANGDISNQNSTQPNQFLQTAYVPNQNNRPMSGYGNQMPVNTRPMSGYGNQMPVAPRPMSSLGPMPINTRPMSGVGSPIPASASPVSPSSNQLPVSANPLPVSASPVPAPASQY